MIAQEQRGTQRVSVRSQACCSWLTLDPAGSWEEIYVVGHREMMIPGIEFRFVFHDGTGRLFEVIDFVVEKPAWRNCYCIRVLTRPTVSRHGTPRFLNRISMVAELETRPRTKFDNEEFVYFAHMPVDGSSPSDAQRWIFPLPLVHIARRAHVPR